MDAAFDTRRRGPARFRGRHRGLLDEIDHRALTDRVAARISDKRVVGWYEKRMPLRISYPIRA
jgi:retron-type reverse transcriptase